MDVLERIVDFFVTTFHTSRHSGLDVAITEAEGDANALRRDIQEREEKLTTHRNWIREGSEMSRESGSENVRRAKENIRTAPPRIAADKRKLAAMDARVASLKAKRARHGRLAQQS